jgi:hypothetical protein
MPTSGLFDFFSLDLMPVMPWSIVNLKEIIPPITHRSMSSDTGCGCFSALSALVRVQLAHGAGLTDA